MNSQNPFFSFLIVIVSAIAGLFVVVTVLLSQGNSLAHLCFYILIGGGIFGLLAPRSAFYFWIVACAYSDLLKRLTVVFGEVSKMDLFYVLGITPVMFSGIVISLIIGGLNGVHNVRMNHWMLLLAGTVATVGLGLLDMRASGSVMNAAQGLANGGLYSLLLFVVPVLFPNPQQMLGVFRYVLYVFFPVAIYGIAQQVYGFQPFEIAYLRTGLSIEIKQLFVDNVRAFSTLNSPTALATISAAMMVVCWFLARLPRPVPNQSRRWVGKIGAIILMAGYAGSLVASTGRSAVVVILLGVPSAWCFLRPGRTRFFYAATIGGFLALVAASPWLLSNIDEANRWVSSRVSSESFASQLSTLGTYSDRLFGFVHVLPNPAAYSLFGMWNGNLETLPSELHHHDLISALLLRFGIVPLLFGTILLARMLRKLHKKLYEIEDATTARLMAMSLGLAFALVALSAVSGNVLIIFPINVCLWMAISTAVVCTRNQTNEIPVQTMHRSDLDIASLAGRTPGAKRFKPSRAAT